MHPPPAALAAAQCHLRLTQLHPRPVPLPGNRGAVTRRPGASAARPLPACLCVLGAAGKLAPLRATGGATGLHGRGGGRGGGVWRSQGPAPRALLGFCAQSGRSCIVSLLYARSQLGELGEVP